MAKMVKRRVYYFDEPGEGSRYRFYGRLRGLKTPEVLELLRLQVLAPLNFISMVGVVGFEPTTT